MIAYQRHFEAHKNIYWMNLSRFTTLLIILNISLFFATERVTRQGYYYTYYSLVALLAVEFALLIPVGLMNKVWYYGLCLTVESAALYFLVTSIWYWIRTNRV